MAHGIRFHIGGSISSYIERAEKAAGFMNRAGDPSLGYLYRFEDQCYSQSRNAYDGDEEYVSVGPYLELRAYIVEKKTPRGWRINDRFVGEDHTKQYASPTVKEALAHYIARKARQRSIYENRLNRITIAHELGINLMEQL